MLTQCIMVHGNNISRMQPSLGSSLFLKSNIELLNYFAHGGVCSLLIGIEIQVLLWYQSTPEVAISVTRCWNKKQPKFFQKLPKKQPHQFDLKIDGFHSCPKSPHTFGLLLKLNSLPSNSKNRPIWSHWWPST